MKPFRDTYQMLYNILEVCKEPLLISQITRRSNLSHWEAKDRVENMIKSDMMRKEETSGDTRNIDRRKIQRISTTYITTEKGMKFMETLDSLKQFLK
ncbi:transcriptional regulator [Nitrososphaeria virus YSH_1032793]|uniref:Transcriptional regulator n=1 Tax=Nitrososphaeria virus YSH_1032793 TaxID=3071320 RepID=A0A976YDT2_9CAUD|nr:transcriptional regulator [Yangshan Harbor Nitrososphaeria virus]UVF62258.1 transcriptional regulator [Nitrososphaeria virus YSH_1032793]